MVASLDNFDLKILNILQKDAGLSMDALAEKVSLSRNACWRRVKQMEETGVILARVALVNPEALNLGLTVFVMIKTSSHQASWLEEFQRVIRDMPEIIGAHRMSGDLDYVLRVRVADVRGYDRFYQELIQRIPIADISASFVMDDMKETTALPIFSV